MTYPDVRSGFYLGPSLWLDEASNTQFGAIVRSDGEVSVHKRTYPNGAWSSYTLAGANRTIMDMPSALDDHNYAAIAVDGQGYVHLWTNMHEALTLQYLKSATPGSITSWVQGVLPNMPAGYRLTYPHFVRLNNGWLLFVIRTEGYHDNSRYHFWTMGSTSSVWTWRGILFDGMSSASKRGAYCTDFHADPVSGRVHMGFMWRIDELNGAITGEKPSYIYTDDGITWKDIYGTTMTLPITSTNNVTCQTHTHDSELTTSIQNGGGCCEDQNGYPVFTLNRSTGGGNKDLIRWNGTDWTSTALLNSLGMSSRPQLFVMDSKLHMLCTRSGPDPRRIGFYNLDKNSLITNVGYVNNISPNVYTPAWEQTIDPQAYRVYRTCEFMLPADDLPNVIRLTGGRAKVR